MRKVTMLILTIGLAILSAGCVSREEVDGLTLDDVLKYRQAVVAENGPVCEFVFISNRPDDRVAHYSICVPTGDTEEKIANATIKAAEKLLEAITDCRDICEHAFDACIEQDACFAQCEPES